MPRLLSISLPVCVNIGRVCAGVLECVHVCVYRLFEILKRAHDVEKLDIVQSFSS